MKRYRSISLIETLISLAIVGISVVALLPVMTLKKDSNDMTKGNAYWEVSTGSPQNPADPANNPITSISPTNDYPVSIGTHSLPQNGKFILDNRGFNNIASLFVDKYLFFNGQLVSQDNNAIFLRSGEATDTALQLNGTDTSAPTSYPRTVYVGSDITIIENNPDKTKSFVISNGTTQFNNVSRSGVAIMHGGSSFLLTDATNNLVAVGIGAGNRLTDSNNGSIVIANDFSNNEYANMSGKYLAIGSLKNGIYSDTSNISTSNKYVIYKNLEDGNNLNINVPVKVSGSILARAYIVSSDKNLKDIIGKYTKGLEEILKIKPVVYTYKSDEKNTEFAGIIAQDLQKIFPESVFKDRDGFLSVNTDATFYATLNSIKTLNKKNTVLEESNKNLEDKVNELRKIRDNLRANKGGKNE